MNDQERADHPPLDMTDVMYPVDVARHHDQHHDELVSVQSEAAHLKAELDEARIFCADAQDNAQMELNRRREAEAELARIREAAEREHETHYFTGEDGYPDLMPFELCGHPVCAAFAALSEAPAQEEE